MLEVLARWNRWGTATLPSGLARDISVEAKEFLLTPEILALVGPRRAGKTTVMHQLMDELERLLVPKEAMLHLNLEDPGLGPVMGPQLLDAAYQTWRERVYPKGRAFLLLDEVQRVPGWERWVRARTESEGIKVVVTGSSSALMSREMGSLLTGRHITLTVNPLSFSEYLRFTNRELPTHPERLGNPPELRNAALEFLQWGGFPEVVLAASENRKERLLTQYFDDILFKDIALRHDIRGLQVLRALAALLMQETASLHSFGRLATRLATSTDLVRDYCDYLAEAYLVAFLPFCSFKEAERQRRPQKCHAWDTGLRNALCLGRRDLGRVAESAVWRSMASRSPEPVTYWKGKQEVDLVRREGGKAVELVQVVLETSQPATLKREVVSLHEGARAFPEAKLRMVHADAPTSLLLPGEVDAVPLWRYLL